MALSAALPEHLVCRITDAEGNAVRLRAYPPA